MVGECCPDFHNEMTIRHLNGHWSVQRSPSTGHYFCLTLNYADAAPFAGGADVHFVAG